MDDGDHCSGVGRPERRHLKRLPRIFGQTPLYLVTAVTLRRQKVLAEEQMAAAVREALRQAAARHGWIVGKYVVMPDHLHFFCCPAEERSDLSRFVGGFKEMGTRAAWAGGWRGRLWQREFFDHLLRSGESYEEKWHYVLLNPVRAGLCSSPDDWPYQGEIEPLEFVNDRQG